MSRKSLIVASVDDAALVIYNGTTIYHEEEDEPDFINRNFSARQVATQLAEAIKMAPIEVKLIAGKDVPEDWDFDDVRHAALMRARR